MEAVLLVIHLIVTLALIGVVLLQRSEGGALGIGGSGGSGGNLFSARGAANALTRATAVLAVVFFATSIALTIISVQKNKPASVFEQVGGQNAPASPAPGAPSPLPKLPGGAPELPSAPARP